MSKRPLYILIASLFAVTPALAQSDTASDPFRSEGSATAGGIVTQTNSTTDASKFEEYQDLNNGMLSNIFLKGRNSKSWIDAYGENFGRDDMYVNIRGGMYDVFKARAYTNWMPHNFLYDGLTPFTGSGSSTLTAKFPSASSATWQNLNLGYERKDTGGYFEWQQTSPWYVRFDGNQVKTEGTKVGSSSNGTSPGQGFTDLALPVQYETNNASFEGGYTTKTMTFTASYLISNFGNSNATVTWNNPYFTNEIDHTYLPPANQYQRVSLNGVVRALPWNSTLAARYTWDKTTSDTTIGTSVLNGTGASANLPVMPDTNTFNGNETRQTFTLGWAATPTAGLDTKFYFNWQEMKNDSTEVTFCPSGAASCGGTFENELWNYKKENAGIDAYWRINKSNRIGGGYDYNHMTQNRVDFDDTTTNTFWVEWKNNSLDNLSARLKYSYIDRHSNFLLGNAGKDANDPEYLSRYVYAFDLADLTQNRVKLTLDWAAADNVGVALEVILKDNDYNSTALGRQKDKRWEVFGNLTYGDPSSWRVNLFADYEDVRYDSDHRYVGAVPCNATTGPNCYDPSSPPTSASYNWSASVKNNNWMIGLGIDVPVNDQFMVTGSILYDQVDGTSDMTSQKNYGNPLPLPNYPNIKQTSLNLKGVYKFDRNWSLTAGYAYQKYDYNDDQFAGYINSLPSINATTGVETPTQRSYLNGWNAFQSYSANIVYLLGTFRF